MTHAIHLRRIRGHEALNVRPDVCGSMMPLDGIVGERDGRIVRRAIELLGGSVPDWGDAVRALSEAVLELIPSGRCYFLGECHGRPVVGSLVSGVGITPGIDSIQRVVRGPHDSFAPLGKFGP
jgi:hypothetical protein